MNLVSWKISFQVDKITVKSIYTRTNDKNFNINKYSMDKNLTKIIGVGKYRL